jgi:hypothetical protein
LRKIRLRRLRSLIFYAVCEVRFFGALFYENSDMTGVKLLIGVKTRGEQ